MTKHVAFSLLFLIGCGKKRDPFPWAAASSDSGNANAEAGGVQPDDCVETWAVLADGVVVQPESCLAWSPPSATNMTWYEAASIEDGEAGGCGNDCPDGDGYCATLEFEDRTDWRLPSFDELKAAALSNPEIPDKAGKLWSRQSGQGSTSNAWVVDLSQAVFWIELDKEDAGVGVRCVSD